jgi:hypothetical protein
VLLPLRDVEGARRMREDVRNAEVCVAVVGHLLRHSEEQSDQGCLESGAAVSSARARGAGGGGCAWRGHERFAVTTRIGQRLSIAKVALKRRTPRKSTTL